MSREGNGPRLAMLKTMLRDLLGRRDRFLVARPDPKDGWVILMEKDTYDEAWDWLQPRKASMKDARILTESEWARRVMAHLKGE